MQSIIRSIFKAESDDNLNLMYDNIQVLRASGIEFLTIEYHLVWDYVDRFAKEHAHAPSIVTLRNQFEKIDNNPDVLNQLEIIRLSKPVYKGDFFKRIEVRVEEQRTRKLESLLKECNEISYIGMEIKDGRNKKILKGSMDAIKYVTSKAAELGKSASGVKKDGDVITEADVDEFSADYDRRKSDPEFGKGYKCGIDQFDQSLGGAKKGQMWTHAAFTGHLKSTLGMNWVYYQSIYHHENSVFFSFEMPYDQCKRIIYTMHSMHEKFTDARLDLGIQEYPNSLTGLSYKKIRDGVLNENEERYLKEVVLKDLRDPKNEYGKIQIRSYDTDKMSYTVMDAKNECEACYRKNPFGFIVVDHALLMSSVERHPNTTEKANEVVRDLKKLAEIFNKGDGAAVLTLFQISREGIKRADKSNGMYSLYDLSYSNEIERSSDVVTASFLSKNLSESSRVLLQCLKSRDDSPPQPFFSRIEWPCRRIITCLDPYDSEVSVEEAGFNNNLESIFN